MITLITGTPGAGKTLYAISKLLSELVGKTIDAVDSAGAPCKIQRVVHTNINGLLLDHQLIDGSSGGGLGNWSEWCKPGDVICFDEVQREWPPRPSGAKVPLPISALETHRHLGVDFIILTQHPMLIDNNVRALVGRHIHIRRIGGLNYTIAYEWDHCSRTLLFSKSLKKSPFKYDKNVFKLYKSAELHTKPKNSIPPLAYVVLAAVVAAAVFIPSTFNRIASKSSQPAPSVATPTAVVSTPAVLGPAVPGPGSPVVRSKQGGYDASIFVPVVSNVPYSAPAYDDLRQVVAMPRITTAICPRDLTQCICYTQQGTVALRGLSCNDWAVNRPFDPYLASASQDSFSDSSRPASYSSQPPSSGLPSLIGGSK